jgi:hypothetical protein
MNKATLKTAEMYIHLLISEAINTVNLESWNNYVRRDKATEIIMCKADAIQENRETTGTQLGDLRSLSDVFS